MRQSWNMDPDIFNRRLRYPTGSILQELLLHITYVWFLIWPFATYIAFALEERTCIANSIRKSLPDFMAPWLILTLVQFFGGPSQLSSNGAKHDELDFEFLGSIQGKPWTLQTNVLANGVGNKEQRLHLWFDPAKDFHSY